MHESSFPRHKSSINYFSDLILRYRWIIWERFKHLKDSLPTRTSSRFTKSSCNDSLSLISYSDEPTGRLALVFELMDMNFYEAIKGRRHYIPESRVKVQIYQVLKSIDHMHKKGIFHRDIKPENILVKGD